jgi:hypothetical protein
MITLAFECGCGSQDFSMITIRFTTDYALYARMRLLACRWAGGEELTSEDEVLILFCYAAVRLRPAPIPCAGRIVRVH